MAEEVKEPGRIVPKAMVFSFLLIGVMYLALAFCLVAILGESLADSSRPISDAAGVFLGGWGVFAFGICAILAIISSVNAGIMAASRYPLALGRDQMLPESLAAIHRRFKTPHNAIFLTGLVIIVSLFADLTMLVKAASSVLILTYIFASLAVIILRESRVQNYRPHFGWSGYPWSQLVGILGFLALLVTCVMGGGGFLVYWFHGRKRASQEYALLHLIERITARELTSHSLESELKQIIHERDEILKDRFDHLIEASTVLDLSERTSLEEFSKSASAVLSERMDIDRETLYRLLLARERESSTVLSPFLAIPHVIVDGEHKFDVLLARCREGIVFSDSAPAVHTVFLLVGTCDERPFHLRTLAAICQIAQEDDFESRWMSAKGSEAIRDIVLLGKRQRDL